MSRFRLMMATAALAICGCVGTGPRLPPALPAAPQGFSWTHLPEVSACLLVPDGWHLASKGGGKKRIYTISQEDVAAKGSFETGLTYTVWRQVSTKEEGRVKPSAFAAALLQGARRSRPIEAWDSREQGPYQAVRYQFVDAPPGLVPVRVYNLLFANDTTGTLHMFTFEAPTAGWDKAWKTAEVILGKLAMDDEV